jgi:hypothetical protein
MKKSRPTFSWYVRSLRARAIFSFDKLLDYRRLRRKFFEMHLHHLDLQNPVTHSEKVQYRKLFDRRAVYPQITDKIEARNYVDSVLGAGAADRLMVPLLAVVDRFEDLDPALKQQDIIIKASHGSGWNQVVRAGSEEDWTAATRRSRHWLARIYGVRRYEWAYLDLRPRLLVEVLLPEVAPDQAMDFKIYCYNGEIRSYLAEDNRSEVKKFSLYNQNFVKEDMSWPGIENCPFVEPIDFEAMQDVAKKLAEDFDMLRVDFLVLPDRWYLGEMTLYDGSGMIPFNNYKADKAFGRYWCHREITSHL